jgi:hypothetical protein
MNDIPMLRPYLISGSRVWLQAARIWPILTGFVMFSDRNPRAPATITYGELAQRMGYSTRNAGHTLGRALELIGQVCIATGLPALNAIVVGQTTGAPGVEVLLREGYTVEEEQAAVMETEWHQWRAPSASTFRRAWEALSGTRLSRV